MWKPLLMALALTTLLAGCGRDTAAPSSASHPADPPPAKPVIVVSIYPLASIVGELTDEWATVRTMMPPESDPRAFAPSPVQCAMLRDADALVVAGMHVDDWAVRSAKAMGKPNLKIIDFAQLVGSPARQLRPSRSGDELWMDPLLTDHFIDDLFKELSPLVPDHVIPLHNRDRLMRTHLLDLHQRMALQLSQLRNSRIVTYGNAFDLLARRYGLQVLAHLDPIELPPGGSVSPTQLAPSLAAIARYHLKSLYAPPRFPESVAKTLAARTGVTVYQLDDMGNPAIPGHRDYLEMMETNFTTLHDGQWP